MTDSKMSELCLMYFLQNPQLQDLDQQVEPACMSTLQFLSINVIYSDFSGNVLQFPSPWIFGVL